jgi:hypothetical protein
VSTLVGREWELAALIAVLDQATNGHGWFADPSIEIRTALMRLRRAVVTGQPTDMYADVLGIAIEVGDDDHMEVIRYELPDAAVNPQVDAGLTPSRGPSARSGKGLQACGKREQSRLYGKVARRPRLAIRTCLLDDRWMSNPAGAAANANSSCSVQHSNSAAPMAPIRHRDIGCFAASSAYVAS